MFLSNMDYIPNTELEILGLVRGGIVLSKDVGSDFMAGLVSIVGGELVGYTDMLEDARRIATERMEAQAEKLYADAVINIRYSTSAVMAGAAEIMAYGTAVRYKQHVD